MSLHKNYVVAQKISPLKRALYKKNHRTSAPPIHTFFKLHQHYVPKKIRFFMKIYGCKNENTFQSEKLEKSEFHCFHPCHVGVLCSKTLTVNGNPWSDFDNFYIFQHFFFLKNMNLPGPI